MRYDTEEKREKAREATRRWRAKNRDENNAKERERQRKWRSENPELHRARAKKWKSENYDRYKETHAAWRAANRPHLREFTRRQHYRLKYGITPEERDAMLEAQGGVCKICGGAKPSKLGWVVDHCHTKGQVRGILCNPCNLALGYVRDNVEIMRAMIRYIEGK